MDSFNGKTAIVTGGTSGIGEDIALRLIQLGTKVIISGRNLERGGNIESQSTGSSMFIAGDIKKPEVNLELVNLAMEKFGRLDYVVLSAGMLGIGRLDKLSLDDWHDTISTNLSAVFYLLKSAIPAMMESGGGSIVIIGSVASYHAFPNHPAYTASKGALPALVKQIARDYGPSVRINLVSPAQVETPLLHNSLKAFENRGELLKEITQRLPMKRLGLPADITHTVIHLLSEQSSWITGADFVVDGGFLTI